MEVHSLGMIRCAYRDWTGIVSSANGLDHQIILDIRIQFVDNDAVLRRSRLHWHIKAPMLADLVILFINSESSYLLIT